MIPKFRAWDPHKKKMVDDTELVIWGGNIYQGNRQKIFERIVEGKKGLIGYSIDDKYLMQSTGLFDKNGTEIFEGDVVVTNGWRRQVITFGTQEVEEDFGSVRIYKGFNLYLGGGYPNAVMSTFEVIGNIYENPELMEVSDDQ